MAQQFFYGHVFEAAAPEAEATRFAGELLAEPDAVHELKFTSTAIHSALVDVIHGYGSTTLTSLSTALPRVPIESAASFSVTYDPVEYSTKLLSAKINLGTNAGAPNNRNHVRLRWPSIKRTSGGIATLELNRHVLNLFEEEFPTKTQGERYIWELTLAQRTNSPNYLATMGVLLVPLHYHKDQAAAETVLKEADEQDKLDVTQTRVKPDREVPIHGAAIAASITHAPKIAA